MIDTHCHIDLYKNPLQIIKECEKAGIITIGMTNLPSHFALGYSHVLPFKKVRLALGMHPLYAKNHAQEFDLFVENLSKTSYIGEIGLDYSKEGIGTKDLQLNSFKRILNELNGKRKILSLHSRRAEKDVLKLLIENKIKNAIFHWYSGPLSLVEEIVKAEYYFSINHAMIQSASGREIISKIPFNRVLTETDGPFIQVNKRPVEPKDISSVYEYLSNFWNKSLQDVKAVIYANFAILIDYVRI